MSPIGKDGKIVDERTKEYLKSTSPDISLFFEELHGDRGPRRFAGKEASVQMQRGCTIGIEGLIKALAGYVKRTVDLRYSDGKWSVLVARGNIMVCVPGTVGDDPLESLMAAIERWETRSVDNPF